MADLPSFTFLPPLPPKPKNSKTPPKAPTVSIENLPLPPTLPGDINPLNPRTSPPKKVSTPIAGPLPVLPGAAAFREPVRELDLEGDIEFLEETPLPKSNPGLTTKIGAYETTTTINPYSSTTQPTKKYKKLTIILISIGVLVVIGIIVFTVLNIINLNATPELKPIPVITVDPDSM